MKYLSKKSYPHFFLRTQLLTYNFNNFNGFYFLDNGFRSWTWTGRTVYCSSGQQVAVFISPATRRMMPGTPCTIGWQWDHQRDEWCQLAVQAVVTRSYTGCRGVIEVGIFPWSHSFFHLPLSRHLIHCDELNWIATKLLLSLRRILIFGRIWE